MGNILSPHNTMDHDGSLILEFVENADLSYSEFLNVLQRVINRRIPNRLLKMKMPIIRKRPDLTIFCNTTLYKEIKSLTGYSPDSQMPNDFWSLEKILRNREIGIGCNTRGAVTENQYRKIANMYIPNHKKNRLILLDSKVFCGSFNKTGSRLITASQDHIIRIFDSSKGTYHRINRINARDVSWCILDIDFSPDEQYFVYSTWSDYLYVSKVNGQSEDLQWLHLNTEHSRSCIFSVRFSPSGNILMGGANDGCIYMYDRENESRLAKIKINPDEYTDINAVCFLDNSSNLFVSGCDDGIIKLWDSRCIGARSEPVGIFVGHFDGITYIDSRNDGRYFLSNSKDQSIKIWDTRRFSPKEKETAVRNTVTYNWDYRWDNVPREFYNPQRDMEGDASVMTYRGHRVTKSLIRAKFSPAEQTGQRYIYTGCGTGRVIIYDVLTGQIKEAIEGHRDIVRDVAWHPERAEIVSSSWDTHVNLNTYKRTDSHKRRRSESQLGDDDQPLRRSRRIACRNMFNFESEGDTDC